VLVTVTGTQTVPLTEALRGVVRAPGWGGGRGGRGGRCCCSGTSGPHRPRGKLLAAPEDQERARAEVGQADGAARAEKDREYTHAPQQD